MIAHPFGANVLFSHKTMTRGQGIEKRGIELAAELIYHLGYIGGVGVATLK